ncbi:MAG: amidohydrolase family protein, partial [Bacteroidales bacterium]|nr:amidohydrolase family protein [Bacteroidales bacterium]
MDRRDFLKTSALGAAALGFMGLGGSCKVHSRYDTIIRNGVIYAGDGAEPITGDIAILDGRIAAIGQDLGDSAKTILDAKGMAVSPGFIDIHSHTDTNLLDAPKGDSRIFQGVTAEVGGNCGSSPFPGKTYPGAEAFYKRLSDNKIGINYASLVGHGDIR